jgi:hypothetical protein
MICQHQVAGEEEKKITFTAKHCAFWTHETRNGNKLNL